MEIKSINVKWVIPIPERAKILVKAKEKVASGQCLGEIVTVNEKILDYGRIFELLSSKDRENMIRDIEGKTVVEGEVLYETAGMFGKKVISPIGGKVIKVDEFYNIYVKLGDDKIEELVSPTEATVVSIDNEELVLEFKAQEYLGKPIVDGKGWGIEGIKEIERVVDLSSADEGKIMVTKQWSPALFTKAEVVGIKGIVVLDEGLSENDDKINFKLPILALEEKLYNHLSNALGLGQKALINATKGRLLVVTDKHD